MRARAFGGLIAVPTFQHYSDKLQGSTPGERVGLSLAGDTTRPEHHVSLLEPKGPARLRQECRHVVVLTPDFAHTQCRECARKLPRRRSVANRSGVSPSAAAGARTVCLVESRWNSVPTRRGSDGTLMASVVARPDTGAGRPCGHELRTAPHAAPPAYQASGRKPRAAEVEKKCPQSHRTNSGATTSSCPPPPVTPKPLSAKPFHIWRRRVVHTAGGADTATRAIDSASDPTHYATASTPSPPRPRTLPAGHSTQEERLHGGRIRR